MPEQLIFVLVFVLISVLNAVFRKGGFLEKMKESGESSPPDLPFPHAADTGELHPHRPTSVSPPPTPGQSAEEVRVRKFLEALGLPPEAMPPARETQPARREVTAPRRRQATTPAPQPRVPVPKPTVRRGIEPPPRREYTGTIPTLAPKLSEAEQAALNRLEQGMQSPFDIRPAAKPATGISPAGHGGISIRDLLASPGNLRAAVVIREILDPPAGLRDPAL